MSSVAGLKGSAILAGYCATKGGVRLFTKAVAMECANAKDVIRVNSVHPGMIDTKMVHDALGGHDVDVSPVTKKLAIQRQGRPEEIAQLVLFLASDRSSYSTGAEFVADGGSTATHALNVSS